MALTECLFLYLFVFVNPAFAGFSFSIPDPNIDADQEVEADVSLELKGQSGKDYFLEGAFKKVGTTNYFGLTANGSDWVKYTASDYRSLPQVTTDGSGRGNGKVKVKVDKDSPHFAGAGDYLLRFKRFTANGSTTWSDNSLTVRLIGPVGSALPTPSAANSTQATFSISGLPSTIGSDEPVNVRLSLSGITPNSRLFLKGAFYKEGSTNYFGLTQVNGNFIKNSQAFSSQFPAVTDANGNWQSSLEIKVDESDSGFTGEGDYLFKVARYSENGGGPFWSNSLRLYINQAAPDADPSPKPAQASSPSPKPSSRSSAGGRVSTNPISSNLLPGAATDTATVAGALTASGTGNPTASKTASRAKTDWRLAFVSLLFIGLGVVPIARILKKPPL